MSDRNLPEHPSGSPFDALKHSDEDGEFWTARDLMALLAYDQWRRFEDAIERAQLAAQNAGHDVDRAFCRLRQEGTGGAPRIDYRLTRFAAYLVAMNGDPRKARVAEAQAYFAVKAREAEVPAELDELEFAERHLQMVKAKRAAETRALAAEQKAKEFEQKAESYDIFLGTDGVQRMDIVAKEFGTTAIRLFAILRDEGVLMEGGRRHNVPYAAHAQHFKVVAQSYETNTRGQQSTSTTYVRPSGYDLIRKVLDRRARRQQVEAFHQRGLEEAS